MNRICNLKKVWWVFPVLFLTEIFHFPSGGSLKMMESSGLNCYTKLLKFNIGFSLLPPPCFPYLEAGNCSGINPPFFLHSSCPSCMNAAGLGTRKNPFSDMGILNQLNSYLRGHLSSNRFKVFSEFVHGRLHLVTVSLKNPTFLFE